MKRILFLLFLCVAVHSLSAQRGIGTNSPDPSAVLDLTSTTQGFLPPRMTYAQMTAIVSPTAGLTVYCTDCEPVGFHYYDGSFFLNTRTGNISGNLTTLDDTAVSFTGTTTFSLGDTYTSADGISISIPYTDWGGNTHNPIAFNSTDVWGLKATLDPASLTAGNGNAIFNITGIADVGGAGSSETIFNIELGGLSATVSYTVVDTRVPTSGPITQAQYAILVTLGTLAGSADADLAGVDSNIDGAYSACCGAFNPAATSNIPDGYEVIGLYLRGTYGSTASAMTVGFADPTTGILQQVAPTISYTTQAGNYPQQYFAIPNLRNNSGQTMKVVLYNQGSGLSRNSNLSDTLFGDFAVNMSLGSSDLNLNTFAHTPYQFIIRPF